MRVTSSCLAVLTILQIFAVALPQQEQAVEVSRGYDPGLCANSTRGKLKIVKNRENKDALLICFQENEVYKWKMADGSSALGEIFISPGYDCSDILNSNTDSKDGFYWIHLNETTPKRVWCDMTTERGGFILFGYQNSAVTWNVPSHGKPVDPIGSPHWSSVLGNTPILDIRVQVSKSKNFKDTVSDWSFRLKNKRSLKNLMLHGEKGCDRNSPGIGDIAYVKDLKSGKIVTTNFRCSKFGVAYQRNTKYGWAKMNSCLQRPCRVGYAYHLLSNGSYAQIDHYGSFSYSTKRPVTGYALNATSFIGCSTGKCCACYGPVGGTGEYCADGCQPINGGKVLKTAYVWFWVRTTMPKKVWRKCMEFQRRLDNGQLEWYKLLAGDKIAIKGRCTRNELQLSEVAVVSDSVALNNLPRVPGLLAYRKQNDRFYVRSGYNSWRTVPEQSEIISINNELLRLKSKISRLEGAGNVGLERRIANLEGTEVAGLKRRITNLEGADVAGLKRRVAELEDTQVVGLKRRITNLEGTDVAGLKSRIAKLEERQVKIRLSSNSRGRIEIYHPSYGWGTVCDDSWDISDGHVVCRQLGFERATAVHSSAHYGEGDGPILLDDVECTGNEYNLWDCPHEGWNVENCGHGEDASVDCTSVKRIRLSAGHYGRVEVYHPSHGWGTVCDDDWDINDGHVVCRQLRYSRATAVYQSAYYGEGSGPILLDNLNCAGNEVLLWDCPHEGWNEDNCSHSEDASVRCE